MSENRGGIFLTHTVYIHGSGHAYTLCLKKCTNFERYSSKL